MINATPTRQTTPAAPSASTAGINKRFATTTRSANGIRLLQCAVLFLASPRTPQPATPTADASGSTTQRVATATSAFQPTKPRASLSVGGACVNGIKPRMAPAAFFSYVHHLCFKLHANRALTASSRAEFVSSNASIKACSKTALQTAPATGRSTRCATSDAKTLV